MCQNPTYSGDEDNCVCMADQMKNTSEGKTKEALAYLCLEVCIDFKVT